MIKRHPLDTDERTILLSGALSSGFLEQFLKGTLDLRKVFEELSQKAKKLDETASVKFKEGDLVDYGERMQYGIVDKLAQLEVNLRLYESGNPAIVGAIIPLMGFLTAEITGLERTVYAKEEEARAI
ncbi:MAG: hypothetical protein WC796_04750 [Candidatus Pacearchaeota archaeon]|jgi:hypothetical protein